MRFLSQRLSSWAQLQAIFLFIFLARHAAGQPGALPCGLNYNTYKTIQEENLPSFDLARFNAKTSGRIAEETIAYTFKTHFVPGTDGNWKTRVPGVESWFLKLRSDGAHGVALVFSGVALLPGERLYVYNQNGMRGPYTHRMIPPSGILPLDFLKGNEIMIEYDVPAGSKSRGTFVVERVSHAYRNIFDREVRTSKAGAGRFSDDCYLCMDALDQERRATVKLVVQYENGSRICTGTLVNNTAHDKTPYILTAEHCVSNQYDADRTVFIFDYEDERCVNQIQHEDFMLAGAYYRASRFENDFTILEMYDKPPIEFHPYYAGWDVSDQYLDEVSCVHHPQGTPKRVSVSNGTVQSSTLEEEGGAQREIDAYWNVIRWDVGATDAGSSGAALLNKNKNVIGTLSGGSSECGIPYNDYFQKLSVSWEASPDPDKQLKYWLDPVGSGLQELAGNDPFEDIQVICTSVSNGKPGEQQELLPYTNGSGYFSGYNSDGIDSYAEKFSVRDSARLTGVMLTIGSINTASPGGLMVSVHSSEDGLPGAVLSDSYIPYDRFNEDSLNYISFYPFVKIAGDFFISYTISYSPEDSFALKQVDWRNDSTNTAFVKLPSGWVPMNSISPDGAGSSLGIKITVCEDTVTSPVEEKPVTFYPNPVTTTLITKLPEGAQGEFQLHVYDLQGREQTISYHVYDTNLVVINTLELSSGMYIVKLSTAQGVYQFRFSKVTFGTD